MIVYFPSQFPKGGDIETNALRINKIDALCNSIINSEEKGHEQRIRAIEKEILERNKPNVWNVWEKGNMERVLEVDARKFGIAVTENTNQNIEDITTFTFYASVEHLKEKFKKK